MEGAGLRRPGGQDGRELQAAGRTALAGRFAGGDGVAEDDGALSPANCQPGQRECGDEESAQYWRSIKIIAFAFICATSGVTSGGSFASADATSESMAFTWVAQSRE